MHIKDIQAIGDVIAIAGDYYAMLQPVPFFPHQIPPPPRDFTGRTKELDELYVLVRDKGVTISGLRGMGGIGKTALALKLGEQLSPKYPDAQLYVDLKGTSETPLTPAEAMAHVIRAYHPGQALPTDEPSLRGPYQSVLYNQRAILGLDHSVGPLRVNDCKITG